jgi:hypothetical protein
MIPRFFCWCTPFVVSSVIVAGCSDGNRVKDKPAVANSAGRGSAGSASPAQDAATPSSVDAGMATADTRTTGCATTSSTVPCSDNPDPCNLHSGYPGDEYCILPPPVGMGVQIHFGPKDYKDAEEVAKYTLQRGEEFNAYGIA